MKNPLIWLVVAMSLLFSGCSSTSLTATKSPSVNLSAIKTLRVEKLEADTRGIDKLIVEKLKSMGLEVIASDALDATARVDAVVTYQDKWMWDLGMYMIELHIQLRAPDTRMSFANGHSLRSSLARKSPAGMVDETVGKIFAQQ